MVHIYQRDGIYFPSVTTVIHATIPEPERLSSWKRNNGNWKKTVKNSSTLGTMMHFRILSKVAPQPLNPPMFSPGEIPKDATHRLELCEAMWDDLGLEIGYPRKIERMIINKEHRFAGTPDLVAPINGVYTLADLKSSKELHESYKYQLGGYYELLECTPERGMLISLSTDTYANPCLRAHTVVLTKDELEYYRREFLKLLDEFHSKNMIENLIRENGTMNNHEDE